MFAKMLTLLDISSLIQQTLHPASAQARFLHSDPVHPPWTLWACECGYENEDAGCLCV